MTNLKERLVWCPQCGTDSTTATACPACATCGARLITVVYSSQTGERLTGHTTGRTWMNAHPRRRA